LRSRKARVGDISEFREPSIVPRIGLLLDALPEAVVTTDTAYRINGWNGAAERLFRLTRSTMIGVSIFEILAQELRSVSGTHVKAALDRGEIWTGGAATNDASGTVLELRLTAAPIGGIGAPEGYVVVAYDMTAQVRAQRTAETAEARFADFLAAAPPLAFIKDQDGRYLFVNEHVPRLTGERQGLPWQGQTDYDLWPPALAADIRENDGVTLAGAVPLEYVQIVPLDDGPHALLMYKFPLRGATGEPLLGGIGLDITDRVRVQARAQAEMERGQEREAHASVLARERAVVAGALGRLRSSGTVETIGASIARLVLGLPGLDLAAILLFELDGRATSVGLALESGPVPERRSVPLPRSRTLRRRSKGGPWVEGWKPSDGDPLNEVNRLLEIGVMGYAPIRSGDDLLGILTVGAAGPSGQGAVTERLPAIVEFAGLAGVLLGSSVAARLEYRRARSEIRAVVEQGAFQPVFQPIVELAGRRTVGYEALTRFRDRVAPDVRFAAAAAIGLGPELETATLGAALRAAAQLPPGLWLNINVSPEFALGGDTLRALLATEDRPIVCEVTEHAAIEDYDAFRAAVADLDGVQMAVDDAGAGFSSFRHILELRPAFVKLDRSLVAGIDSDPVRQALIAGMCHFATSSGCRLVAEGIETEAEMATLVELEVPLGQGYLLGYPAPAGAASARP
jgi:PAS domain S-box-containing protein